MLKFCKNCVKIIFVEKRCPERLAIILAPRTSPTIVECPGLLGWVINPGAQLHLRRRD